MKHGQPSFFWIIFRGAAVAGVTGALAVGLTMLFGGGYPMAAGFTVALMMPAIGIALKWGRAR